jgi:hypothetical protein
MALTLRSVAGIAATLALCTTPLLAQADLVVDAQRLSDSWFVEDLDLPDTSCALVEMCAGAPGVRRLLKFDTLVANLAQTDLVLGSPLDNPLFAWSPCHGHYHLEGFSEYRLLDALGNPAAPGRKQAFCLTDYQAYLSEPWVGQRRHYDCDDQGLQAGWSDLYAANLDCQWIDVTNLPGGNYTLEVTLNPDGILPESDYSNNVETVPVTLPSPSGLPPRPDGRRIPGSPLLVSQAGADVLLEYDVTSCPAPDYNLYYGLRGGAWSYAYAGAACGIGTTGRAIVALPDPAPDQLIWFLLVGVDAVPTPVREGGHGFDSSDRERPLSGAGFCSVERTQSGPIC